METEDLLLRSKAPESDFYHNRSLHLSCIIVIKFRSNISCYLCRIFHKTPLLGAFTYFQKATISFDTSLSPSVRMEKLGVNGWVYMELEARVFFENLLRKFNFHWIRTRITDSLHEGIRTFTIISCSILVTMRNVLDNFVKKSKHNIYAQIHFYKNRAVYEIMWENMVEPERAHMKIWLVRIACCMSKATSKLYGYIILIVYPVHEWLCEHVAKLH